MSIVHRVTTQLTSKLNRLFPNSGCYVPYSRREISTTAELLGRRNLRQLFLGNKRGTRFFKEARALDEDRYPDIPVYTDHKPIGYKYGKNFRVVPEMIPELVVPDLKDCPLKPYVSYRANETVEPEFTAKSLFKFIYADKIKNDFEKGSLDDNGQPVQPSEEEKLTAEEAFMKARQTGTDIFSERIPEPWECLNLKKE